MISVIIPVYNGERYLRECIDSVLCQRDVLMEVLLIDDGSTDNSLKICCEYEASDSRIRVFHKENSGVSDTRNFGIDHASGEYIVFVDADDYLMPEALSRIEEGLQQNSMPDMLLWGFVSTENRPMGNSRLLQAHPNGFSSRELLHHLITIDAKQRLSGYIWRCAFKRELLNSHGIRFVQHLKMAEDFKFLLDAVLVAGIIPVIQDALYVYRANDCSVTARYKENVHRDMFWVNSWMKTHVCKIYAELKMSVDCLCAETYIVALQNLCNPGTVYSVWDRIRKAREIFVEYSYRSKVISALKQWKVLTWKRRLVYLMLWMGLESIYIILFSCKKKTLSV